MLGFWTGVLVGAAIVTLAMILLGPSRGVRAETGMDDEVETRLLLGLDPEAADDLDAPAPVSPSPTTVAEPTESTTGEYEALRHLEELDAD